MTIVLAYTAAGLILAGCTAWAWSILGGHKVTCLPRVIARRAQRAVLRARWAWACRKPPARTEGEKLTREEIQVLGNLEAGRDVRSRT